MDYDSQSPLRNLYDAEGSVLALVNTAGTINASYTYDPYGVTTSSGTLAATNPYRYIAGHHDGNGLYHLNARYYDPTLGRFTQLDPSHKSPGYVYSGDDPINTSDPLGEISFPVFVLDPLQAAAVAYIDYDLLEYISENLSNDIPGEFVKGCSPSRVPIP